MGLVKLVRADLLGLARLKLGEAATLRSPRTVVDVLGLPGAWPVLLHRVSAELARRGWGLPAEALRRLGVVLFDADLHPDARIGPGLALAHPVGVTIGPVTVGRDARLMANVRIGGTGPDAHVRVGDACWLFDGAKVVGEADLGDHAVVGTNTVVSERVGAGGVVMGMPGRVVRWRTPEQIGS